MGNVIIEWYREKCKSRWKIAFYATVVIGLITHFYKLTNNLPCHDSVKNVYSSQNIVGSGRWFLSAACSLSSFFDLPWVTGLFSIVFIALTMVVIAELFEMDNPVLISLCSGILVAYPAVTNTLYYSYTADGYMLAMFLAAIGVWMLRFGQEKKICFLLAGVLFCIVCGIYQAYVSFALVLAIAYLIKELLEKDRKIKEILVWIFSRVSVMAIALGLYYIVWKVCLAVQKVSATTYQGMDKIGQINSGDLKKAFAKMIKNFIISLLGSNIFETGLTAFAVVSIIFLLAFVVAYAVIVKKSGIFRRKSSFAILLLCPFAAVFCAYMWFFVSRGVAYHMIMLQSLSIIYIMAVYLADRWLRPKASTAFAGLTVVLVSAFVVLANTGYHLLDKNYESAYAQSVEMLSRIYAIADRDGIDVQNIAILGRADKETQKGREGGTDIISVMIETPILLDHRHASAFLKEFTSTDLMPVEQETVESLERSELTEGMGTWPEADSIRIVGDTAVVNLGNEDSEE